MEFQVCIFWTGRTECGTLSQVRSRWEESATGRLLSSKGRTMRFTPRSRREWLIVPRGFNFKSALREYKTKGSHNVTRYRGGLCVGTTEATKLRANMRPRPWLVLRMKIMELIDSSPHPDPVIIYGKRDLSYCPTDRDGECLNEHLGFMNAIVGHAQSRCVLKLHWPSCERKLLVRAYRWSKVPWLNVRTTFERNKKHCDGKILIRSAAGKV